MYENELHNKFYIAFAWTQMFELVSAALDSLFVSFVWNWALLVWNRLGSCILYMFNILTKHYILLIWSYKTCIIWHETDDESLPSKT